MRAPLSGIGGLGWGEDGGTSRVCPQTLPDMGFFCEISGNPSWFLAAPSWRPLGLPTFSPLPGSPSDNSLMPALTSPEARHVSSVVPQDSAPSSSPPQGLYRHIPNTFCLPSIRLGISYASYRVLVPVLGVVIIVSILEMGKSRLREVGTFI